MVIQRESHHEYGPQVQLSNSGGKKSPGHSGSDGRGLWDIHLSRDECERTSGIPHCVGQTR